MLEFFMTRYQIFGSTIIIIESEEVFCNSHESAENIFREKWFLWRLIKTLNSVKVNQNWDNL